MSSKLKELQDTLVSFIRQEEHSVLVIALAEDELVYLYKLIESLDEQDAANVYSIFAQPATAPEEYVDAIVGHLREQLEPVNVLRVHDGQPAWPPLPESCINASTPPSGRVRAAIEYARALVPTERGNRLVWSLVPIEIPDRHGYAEIVGSLLPKDGTPDWLYGVRLILRDDRAAPVVLPMLYRDLNPHVLTYEPDLSPAAMMDAMAREVADPRLAEPNRMQLLAQLAALDHAHGRFQEAAGKYEVLYTYYARHNVPEMQALVLNGIGDVMRRLGQLPTARERYGQGLTVALGTQSLPLILNLAIAVGDTSMELEQYTDAEEHWNVGLTIARALRNSFVEADLMEKTGTARQILGRIEEAVKVWREGVEVSRGAGYQARECSILERLLVAYERVGLTQERLRCEEELRAAESAASSPMSKS